MIGGIGDKGYGIRPDDRWSHIATYPLPWQFREMYALLGRALIPYPLSLIPLPKEPL